MSIVTDINLGNDLTCLEIDKSLETFVSNQAEINTLNDNQILTIVNKKRLI